jgi:hypothetical protein
MTTSNTATEQTNDQRIAQQVGVGVNAGPVSVTATSDWNKIVNFFTGNSHAYRSMSSGNRDKYDEYKKDLQSAINRDDKGAASKALKNMANTMRSDLVGQTDAQTRGEMQGVINACDNLSKEVVKPSYNLRNLNVGLISQNSTDGTGGTVDANDALIATFSENGKATGEIKDLSKAINELKSAGYSSDQIEKFASAYFEKQGVPESQRAALVADATSKAGQTSTDTTLASAGSSADRQR